jgi:hypothetical protein
VLCTARRWHQLFDEVAQLVQASVVIVDRVMSDGAHFRVHDRAT